MGESVKFVLNFLGSRSYWILCIPIALTCLLSQLMPCESTILKSKNKNETVLRSSHVILVASWDLTTQSQPSSDTFTMPQSSFW